MISNKDKAEHQPGQRSAVCLPHLFPLPPEHIAWLHLLAPYVSQICTTPSLVLKVPPHARAHFPASSTSLMHTTNVAFEARCGRWWTPRQKEPAFLSQHLGEECLLIPNSRVGPYVESAKFTMSEPLRTCGQPVLPSQIHQSGAYPSVWVPERFLHISLVLILACAHRLVSEHLCHPAPPHPGSWGTLLQGDSPLRKAQLKKLLQSRHKKAQADNGVLRTPRCPGSPLCFLKFSFSHLLTRPLLSKIPSAHSMLGFQGTSGLILNGWFMRPSLRRIVELCHLNFRTPVPFLFTFCCLQPFSRCYCEELHLVA